MDYEAWPNLTGIFFHQAKRLADKPVLWRKRAGAYRPLTWREVEAGVKDLSRGLRALGVAPGDRVVLVAENRPEWFIADLAIIAAGAITVPAYTTNTKADHQHILTNSGATGAIVSTKALARQLLPAAAIAPDCEWVIAIDDLQDGGSDQIVCHAWEDVQVRGRELPDDVEEVAARSSRDDLACFIYTSGTGGTPKGVMLSHGNMLHNCAGAHDLLTEFGLGDEVFLCFLPLSHAYEHTVGQFFPMCIGAEIYYCEGADQLLKNLGEARPTYMTAVPRLYESMYQRIKRGVAKERPIKQKLFALTETLGRKRLAEDACLSLGERLLDQLMERLVREKFRQRFGGRLKAMVSGGAALNPEIGHFFAALGLCVLQGYGQTEASPVISANRPRTSKMDTVGPPLKGVEIKIAEDGEILVRGPLVMKGYWRDETATAAAIRDGWLHTGDIGELDNQNRLKITDRKKDIIVLAGGDNVSPARIEGLLTLEPEIGQAMVYGDKRPHLVGLLVPDDEFVKSWAKENGASRDVAALAQNKAFHQALSQVVDRVNKGLANLERVRRFVIAQEAFSTENGLLTPTMKIRRHKIRADYGAELEGLYR